MKILLKKVRVRTIFSLFDPVVVEPLELEYLEAVCREMGAQTQIVDEAFGAAFSREGEPPDLIVLNGYNVSENRMLEEAWNYRKRFPLAKIAAGGVHVQQNAASFRRDPLDYVVHSASLEAFRDLVRKIQGGPWDGKGYDFKEEGVWRLGGSRILEEAEAIRPWRDFFDRISVQTRYLDKSKVAIIKGSTGCPFRCSYCYCKTLNGGVYVPADQAGMIREMAEIPADFFWIVDDVLFAGRDEAKRWLQKVQETSFQGKVIAYMRADFVAANEDLMQELKDSGLREAIIGFEAVSDRELERYRKGTEAALYPKVLEILKGIRMDYTALFMVRPDYRLRDFLTLGQFIRKQKIEVFTLSIFTPLPGTEEYGREEKNLTTRDPRRFDFLHLVLKPRLPRGTFYLCFYGLQLRLLKSKRVRSFLFSRIFFKKTSPGRRRHEP